MFPCFFVFSGNRGSPFGQLFFRWLFHKGIDAAIFVDFHDAKARGFLREEDLILFSKEELLYVACVQAKLLFAANYVAPARPHIRVLGEAGLANVDALLTNFYEGHFISEYDAKVARDVAAVMCGGPIDENTVVTEEWLLKLERDYFVKLAMEPLTQERIAHTLNTGKPLRN